MKFLSEFFIIFCACLVYHVESGGDRWNPKSDEDNLLQARFLSFPSGCKDIPPEARLMARTISRGLRKIEARFNEALKANNNDPTLPMLRKFVDSYYQLETSFIEEISTIFKIDLDDFVDVIHNFGNNAVGVYLCAYELFGEGVGDSIDIYEYYLKNLRHDLIGLSESANQCEFSDEVEGYIDDAIHNIKISYNQVKNNKDPDGMITRYNFIEAYERVMWRLYHQIERAFHLDKELWKETIVHNGEDVPENYECAYAAFFKAEHSYFNAYLRFLMDIIQGKEEFSFDDYEMYK